MKNEQNNIKEKLASVGVRLGEYLLFIGLSCVIIYFLMKTIFGNPAKMGNLEKLTNNNGIRLDTILTRQDENHGETISTLEQLNENQTILVNVMAETNRLMQQQSKELQRLKRSVDGVVIRTNIQQTKTPYTKFDSLFNMKYK